MITPTQMRCLQAIRRLSAGGYAPSYREIAGAVGLEAKSSVFHLVNALTERGFLNKISHQHRALRLTAKGRTALTSAFGPPKYFRYDPETETFRPLEVR